MTQIDEKWIEIPRVQNQKNKIVAISNTGKCMKYDGTVDILSLRRKISYCGESVRCYKIIVEQFLVTVKRPDQNCIDHITHNPTEYNMNDVRNLRWCTHRENCCFEEARDNNSKSKRGDKSSKWKGDNVKPQRAYRRALKLYKSGKITEKEFQPYRDARNMYMRQRRIATNTSSPI